MRVRIETVDMEEKEANEIVQYITVVKKSKSYVVIEPNIIEKVELIKNEDDAE